MTTGGTTRSIKIFINGKEVEDNIKSIRAAYAKTSAELNKLERGSEAYNKKISELRQLGGILDEHTSKLKRMDKASSFMSNLGSTFGAMAGVQVMSAGVDKLIEFSDQAYESYKQSEEAATRVEQKLQSLGNTAGLSMDQLAQAATDIMKRTTYDDDAILNDVTNTLLNFQNISGDVFLNAQNAAVDFAANSGRSLEEASTAIGQALENPEKAARKLRAMNILLTTSEQDQIKELQKKGQLQEAQAIILAKIEERYKGQAEALAATDTGKVEQQKNAWGEVEEQFGKVVAQLRGAVAPAFIWLADKAGAALTWMLDHVIYPVWDSISGLFSVFAGAIGQTDLFSGAIKALKGILVGAVMIITTLVGWYTSYYTALTTAIKGNGFLAKSFEFLKTIVSGVFEFLSDLPALFSAIATGAQVIWNAFSKGDFSKNIGAEMQRAFNETRQGVAKINQEASKATVSVATTQDYTAGDGGKAASKAAAARAKAAEKEKADREKARKDLEDHLTKLRELTAKHQSDIDKDAADSTARGLMTIREKYDKEIAEATALEAKGSKEATDIRINLERLQATEIATYRAQARKKLADQLTESQKSEDQIIRAGYQERFSMITELENSGLLTRQEAADKTATLQQQLNLDLLAGLQKRLMDEQAIKNAAKVAEVQAQAKFEEDRLSLLGTSYEKVMAAVTQQYDDLLAAAQKAGMDQLTIDQLNAEKRKALILAEIGEVENALGAMSGAFGALGDAVGQMIDQGGKKMEGWIAFQKLLAIAQVAFDTAKAISGIIAAATKSTTWYEALIGIVSGVAVVLTNMAKARSLLSTPTPKYQQHRHGGYTDVMGADDGRRYRARQLGAVGTGMLPGEPVTLLASEDGAEYIVSNPDLRNPLIASLVAQIDGISRGRGGGIVGAASGGYSTGGAAATQQGDSSLLLQTMMAVLADSTRTNKALLTQIQAGLPVVVDNVTTVDIFDRFRRLNNSAGGTLG